MMNRMMACEMTRRESRGGAVLARPIVVTDEDEREFQFAIDRYKRESGRQFPTWSEILEVLRSIGYAKRIWKPVAIWSPIAHPSAMEGDHTTPMVGWFTTVETPLGP